MAGIIYRGEGELLVFWVAGNESGRVGKAVRIFHAKLWIPLCAFKGLIEERYGEISRWLGGLSLAVRGGWWEGDRT